MDEMPVLTGPPPSLLLLLPISSLSFMYGITSIEMLFKTTEMFILHLLKPIDLNYTIDTDLYCKY